MYMFVPTLFISRPSKIYTKLGFWFENEPSGNPAAQPLARTKDWQRASATSRRATASAAPKQAGPAARMESTVRPRSRDALSIQRKKLSLKYFSQWQSRTARESFVPQAVALILAGSAVLTAFTAPWPSKCVPADKRSKRWSIWLPPETDSSVTGPCAQEAAAPTQDMPAALMVCTAPPLWIRAPADARTIWWTYWRGLVRLTRMAAVQDIMITNFCHFRHFPAKKLAFFWKTSVTISLCIN
jgi:hypothetical protein